MNLYFYTVAKAASDYVTFKVIKPLSEIMGLEHVDLASEAFESGKAFEDVVAANRRQFVAGNRYFGALRMGPISDHVYAADDKLVVHVRDPRDCLTSLYYSVVYSHPVPEGDGREEFLKRRETIASESLDSFCLRQGPVYLQRFERYGEMVDQMPELLLSRYEDMVSDFENWLQRLVEYLELPLSHPAVEQIIGEADFVVPAEDKRRHKRRVTPGDFLDKLAPATIAQLNEMFGPALSRLDYPLIPPRYTLWRRAVPAPAAAFG